MNAGERLLRLFVFTVDYFLPVSFSRKTVKFFDKNLLLLILLVIGSSQQTLPDFEKWFIETLTLSTNNAEAATAAYSSTCKFMVASGLITTSERLTDLGLLRRKQAFDEGLISHEMLGSIRQQCQAVAEKVVLPPLLQSESASEEKDRKEIVSSSASASTVGVQSSMEQNEVDVPSKAAAEQYKAVSFSTPKSAPPLRRNEEFHSRLHHSATLARSKVMTLAVGSDHELPVSPVKFNLADDAETKKQASPDTTTSSQQNVSTNSSNSQISGTATQKSSEAPAAWIDSALNNRALPRLSWIPFAETKAKKQRALLRKIHAAVKECYARGNFTPCMCQIELRVRNLRYVEPINKLTNKQYASFKARLAKHPKWKIP